LRNHASTGEQDNAAQSTALKAVGGVALSVVVSFSRHPGGRSRDGVRVMCRWSGVVWGCVGLFLGPGAWPIYARLYDRRRIDLDTLWRSVRAKSDQQNAGDAWLID
jgi:hypothetical protein